MPTISMSEKFWTAARSTLRPMRPKPLIPSFTAIAVSSSELTKRIPTRSRADQFLDARDDVFHGEAEVLEHRRRGCRFTVGVDADHVAAIAHDRAPIVRYARLDREPLLHRL